MKQLITVKQAAFLTHLRDEPNLSLARMQDDEVNNTSGAVIKKQMKGKSKGKEATMKELE